MLKCVLILLAGLRFASPAQTRADSLYLELQRQGVPYALEWMQVARTEAGYNLDSELAKHHNYFGMQPPLGRATTANGTKAGHATYPSMAAAVACLKARIWAYPYRVAENPYQYLVRTGYNPRGWAYANYVRSVSVSDLVK